MIFVSYSFKRGEEGEKEVVKVETLGKKEKVRDNKKEKLEIINSEKVQNNKNEKFRITKKAY